MANKLIAARQVLSFPWILPQYRCNWVANFADSEEGIIIYHLVAPACRWLIVDDPQSTVWSPNGLPGVSPPTYRYGVWIPSSLGQTSSRLLCASELIAESETCSVSQIYGFARKLGISRFKVHKKEKGQGIADQENIMH